MCHRYFIYSKLLSYVSLKKKPLSYTIFKSPIGKIGVAVTPNGICRVALSIKKEWEFIQKLKSLHPSPKKQPDQLLAIEKEFHLYFKKKLKSFTFPLDLTQGTPFQRSIWEKLISIPYGETRNYQWIAVEIDKPKAFRAVGNANGKNPIPLIIPCHRVIQKNGSLGGFTGGNHLKKYLLDLEQNTHATI